MKMKLLCLSALMLLAGGNASADNLTMPGSACRAYFGGDTNGVNAYGATGLVNETGADIWVSCPMERFGQFKRLYINLYHPSSRHTSCTVGRAHSYTGATEYKSINPGGSGNIDQQFPAFGNSSARSSDVYALYCKLGPGTVLRGYDWLN